MSEKGPRPTDLEFLRRGQVVGQESVLEACDGVSLLPHILNLISCSVTKITASNIPEPTLSTNVKIFNLVIQKRSLGFDTLVTQCCFVLWITMDK